MEDGVKEDPAKPKEVKTPGKAGWLKKSSGKFLASYKDRYVQLDRTEIVVYDNEDLKNCVERLDLENFDKCHELRSPFKKKHRLVLIAPPKSKVSHVKLQAQNQEERDAWIKALSDGINRAKNKIFDEVKVDEGLSLEHVTRSRPKGNRGRRPPTRIHMKEVANVASDGILRLDLDTADNTPNGTHVLTAETGKPELTPSKSLDNISEEPTPPKKVVKPPMPPTKENKPTESQESEAPQKKVLMPPMPPSKEKKPIEEEEPSEVMQEKKVLNPPMPPSKENKPSESQETEAPQKKVPMPPMPPSKEKTPIEEEEPGEVMQEKKVLNPPMPPSKENKPAISANGDATQEKASDSGGESEAAPTPSISSSAPEETDDTESCEPASPKNTSDPPAPPSKDKKPSQRLSSKKEESLSEEDDVDDKDNKDEVEGVEADSQKAAEEEEEEKEEDAAKTEDTVVVLSNKVPKTQTVGWDSPSTALEDSSAEDANKPTAPDTTQAQTPEPVKPASELKVTPHLTPEPVKKAPPAPPKKKPLKAPIKTVDSVPQTVSTSTSPPTTVASSASENESVPQSDAKPDTQETKGELKVVTLPLCSPAATEDNVSGAEAEVEEKSIDSGQLSAEDSESSDQVTSSTDKLQGSLQGLDGEISEEDLESCDSKSPSTDEPSPVILTATPEAAAENSSTTSAPTSPLLDSKTKAASTGDLLELQVKPQGSDMKDLQDKVSIELEETEKLLEEMGPDNKGEASPEILLATAMEKLRQADQFLKEAQGFKELENKSNRTSW